MSARKKTTRADELAPANLCADRSAEEGGEAKGRRDGSDDGDDGSPAGQENPQPPLHAPLSARAPALAATTPQHKPQQHQRACAVSTLQQGATATNEPRCQQEPISPVDAQYPLNRAVIGHIAAYHTNSGTIVEALDEETAERKKLERALSLEQGRREVLEEQLKNERNLRQHLQQQVDALQVKLLSTREEHGKELQAMKNAHHKELQAMKDAHNTDLQAMKDAHHKELQRAADKHGRLEDEIEHLKRLLSEKDRIIADLRSKVSALREENKALRNRVSTLEERVESHDEQLQSMRQSHDEQLQSMQASLLAEMDRRAKAEKLNQEVKIKVCHVISRFLDMVAQEVSDNFRRWSDLHKHRQKLEDAGREADADNLFDRAREVAGRQGVSSEEWEQLRKYKDGRNLEQHPRITKEDALRCVRQLPEQDVHLTGVLRHIVETLRWSRT